MPFLVCFATALILVVFYNPEPHRPYRVLFSWMHRTSGLCLIVLPLLAVYRSRGDFRVHFYNIKQAWTWVFDDFKWLSLMMAASVNTKIKLPDQGKFNAAEKMNFMVLMGTYPLYIATGLFIWLTHVAFVSWLMHTAMALLATPLILGHMYMAIVSQQRPSGPDRDEEWLRGPALGQASLRALVPGALRTRRGRCARGERSGSGRLNGPARDTHPGLLES